ncbi:hypothetical protein HYH03_009109 [Edaphochlamys debaryana]|uniref:Endonuclease/exonuclease/phosphatase domain-containing protein n=1 Tax=Edaphochlamys debaryana TaxID=47281 RepID=A0A835Y249_9CHLO|nr:hypothetical protein HYH03_009109 [Edaphochlamys debaryana]|eukprot:KAG2492696.1 hypothetical protein HYH03_009109 [Edaphochlamys debaryana]
MIAAVVVSPAAQAAVQGVATAALAVAAHLLFTDNNRSRAVLEELSASGGADVTPAQPAPGSGGAEVSKDTITPSPPKPQQRPAASTSASSFASISDADVTLRQTAETRPHPLSSDFDAAVLSEAVEVEKAGTAQVAGQAVGRCVGRTFSPLFKARKSVKDETRGEAPTDYRQRVEQRALRTSAAVSESVAAAPPSLSPVANSPSSPPGSASASSPRNVSTRASSAASTRGVPQASGQRPAGVPRSTAAPATVLDLAAAEDLAAVAREAGVDEAELLDWWTALCAAHGFSLEGDELVAELPAWVLQRSARMAALLRRKHWLGAPLDHAQAELESLQQELAPEQPTADAHPQEVGTGWTPDTPPTPPPPFLRLLRLGTQNCQGIFHGHNGKPDDRPACLKTKLEGLLGHFKTEQLDVVCLQETWVPEHLVGFAREVAEQMGWWSAWIPAEVQPGNKVPSAGVAVLSLDFTHTSKAGKSQARLDRCYVDARLLRHIKASEVRGRGPSGEEPLTDHALVVTTLASVGPMPLLPRLRALALAAPQLRRRGKPGKLGGSGSSKGAVNNRQRAGSSRRLAEGA